MGAVLFRTHWVRSLVAELMETDARSPRICTGIWGYRAPCPVFGRESPRLCLNGFCFLRAVCQGWAGAVQYRPGLEGPAVRRASKRASSRILGSQLLPPGPWEEAA